MSQWIVQVNADLVVTPEQFEQGCTPEAAEPFANVPGMDWKIWIFNRQTGEAGGIKLFENESALQAYLAGPVWASLPDFPAWTNFQSKVFEVLSAPSLVTRAPIRKEAPVTFNEMVHEALRTVPSIKPSDLYRRMQNEPSLLVIDVRDSADVAETGKIAGSVNLAYGSLTYLADREVPDSWQDARLADRSRAVVTTCIMGPLGALGGKLLRDMGFSNVQILEGGVQAWIEAGLPVERVAEKV